MLKITPGLVLVLSMGQEIQKFIFKSWHPTTFGTDSVLAAAFQVCFFFHCLPLFSSAEYMITPCKITDTCKYSSYGIRFQLVTEQ